MWGKEFRSGRLVFRALPTDLLMFVRQRAEGILRRHPRVMRAFVVLIAPADASGGTWEQVLFDVDLCPVGSPADQAPLVDQLCHELERALSPVSLGGVGLLHTLDVFLGPGGQSEYLDTADCVFDRSHDSQRGEVRAT